MVRRRRLARFSHQNYTAPAAPGIVQRTVTYEPDLDRALAAIFYPGGGVLENTYATTGQLDLTRFAGRSYPGGSFPNAIVDREYYTTTNAAAGAAAGRMSALKGPYGINLEFRYFAYDDDRALRCASTSPALACNASSTGDDLVIERNIFHGQPKLLTLGKVKEAFTYTDSVDDRAQAQAFGELRSQVGVFESTNVSRFTYDAPSMARDNLGRIRFKKEALFETGGALGAALWNYRYDARNRLEVVLLNGVESERFGYDLNGNRTTYTTGGVATDATYDDQDRLRTYSDSSFGYYPNGELASKTTPTGSTNYYYYDLLGNLLRVELPGNKVVEYLVDGKGRRIGKKVGLNGALPTLIKRWLYRDSLSPIAELDAAGNLVARYVYATRANTPDYVVRSGRTYRIFSDSIGSPRLVVNTQSLADRPYRADYSAFGVVTWKGATGAAANECAAQPLALNSSGYRSGLQAACTTLTLGLSASARGIMIRRLGGGSARIRAASAEGSICTFTRGTIQ